MNDKTNKYMTVSLIANLFLSIIKIVFGLIGNVKSLIADGIHSLSDLITDFVAIIGNYLSKKPADIDHPRGHGKIEYITSLIISCFIIFLGFSIFKNCFSKRINIPNIYISLVVVITIIVKYFVSHLLIKKGKELNSTILVSSGSESYTDVYSSLLVLFVIVISQFYDRIKLLKYSDIVGSILISVLIFITGIKLLLQSLSLLIGESEKSKDKMLEVKKVIKNRSNKFKLKECIMYKYGSYYEVVLKILVDGNMTVRDGHKLMDDIENDLIKSSLKIKYVTIHIEPID